MRDNFKPVYTRLTRAWYGSNVLCEDCDLFDRFRIGLHHEFGGCDFEFEINFYVEGHDRKTNETITRFEINVSGSSVKCFSDFSQLFKEIAMLSPTASPELLESILSELGFDDYTSTEMPE